MKWVMKDPSPGDMIRVESGTIYHFGVYVSDDEVIQFGLAPSQRTTMRDCDVVVLSSDIDSFLCGGFLEVCEFDKKERKKHRSPAEVIAYARSKIGTGGYSIIYNNCEHFANECISGERISRQAEDVREMFRNLPIADIYIAEIPQREPVADITCDLRSREIEKISNPTVRREKYFAWKLLGYGLDRSLGLKIDDLTFTATPGGRYSCDKVEFSISHSKNALAVAISRKPIGVDIQEKSVSCREGMAERIMNEKELEAYMALPSGEKDGYLIKVWTAKEALFKAAHLENFVPSEYDTTAETCKYFEKTLCGETYSLSVATPCPERIRIYENIKL